LWLAVPAVLGRLMGRVRACAGTKVMVALLNMNKLDIGALESAYND